MLVDEAPGGFGVGFRAGRKAFFPVISGRSSFYRGFTRRVVGRLFIYAAFREGISSAPALVGHARHGKLRG